MVVMYLSLKKFPRIGGNAEKSIKESKLLNKNQAFDKIFYSKNER